MKRKDFLSLALLLTAIPLTAPAQGLIQARFLEITGAKGVECSTSKMVQRDSTGFYITEQAEVYTLRMSNNSSKLFRSLEEAFNQEAGHAFFAYTNFTPMSQNKPMVVYIQTKHGQYRIGERSGARYAVATFNDYNRPNYRTVYAAEWWDEGSVTEAKLVHIYGERPSMSIEDLSSRGITNRTDAAPQQQNGALSMENIPITEGEDINDWMLKAMNNISRLTGGDWLRLFGLLTARIDKVLDREEDLIVIAGLLVDMSNNNKVLDAQERQVCSMRLFESANKVGQVSSYARNMLELAAQKVLIKKQ